MMKDILNVILALLITLSIIGCLVGISSLGICAVWGISAWVKIWITVTIVSMAASVALALVASILNRD